MSPIRHSCYSYWTTGTTCGRRPIFHFCCPITASTRCSTKKLNSKLSLFFGDRRNLTISSRVGSCMWVRTTFPLSIKVLLLFLIPAVTKITVSVENYSWQRHSAYTYSLRPSLGRWFPRPTQVVSTKGLAHYGFSSLFIEESCEWVWMFKQVKTSCWSLSHIIFTSLFCTMDEFSVLNARDGFVSKLETLSHSYTLLTLILAVIFLPRPPV